MSRGMVSLFVVLGLGIVVLLALIFMDNKPVTTVPGTPQSSSSRGPTNAGGGTVDDPRPTPRPIGLPLPYERRPDAGPTPSTIETGVAGYPASGFYGKQADEDRKRLGPAAYVDMERLWGRGHKPKGDPDAQAALDELLRKFPDTHRAGCAAYMLGMHRLRDMRKSQKQRVDEAEDYLLKAKDRYPQSRCDGDVGAGVEASMALAVEVYRYKDPRRAQTMLTELSELPPEVLDTRGQPFSKRAKQLLGNVKPDAPPMSEQTPVHISPPDAGAH
jgi:hypothetical protein